MLLPPLDKKLRKSQLQIFYGLCDEEITALERGKVKLIEPPILALPRLQGECIADADACDKQIACVPLQK